MKMQRMLFLLLTVIWLGGCGYYYYTGPLRPENKQADSMSVADDGTISFVQDRLEIDLKPMTADELNRLFPNHSQAGPRSTNPYTFGDTEFWAEEGEKQRFTVFRLSVKNYSYPKVRIDPSRVVLKSDNKREYWSLSFEQLDSYYRAYAVGYRGNEYERYQERRDLLRRTMLKNEEVFSGQEADGFIVFPALHHDVNKIHVVVNDVVLRFDFRNEPIETINIQYSFQREIGRKYKDGKLELSKAN